MGVLSGVLAKIGLIHDTKEDQNLTDMGEVLDRVTERRCCGVDCCNNRLILDDSVTGGKMVGYSKNGTWTWATEAVYLADKAAGFA